MLAQKPDFFYNASMASKRILILDDALELGRLLKATLNTLNRDLDVLVVSSARETLGESDKGQIDLLIADLKLPAQSTVEVIHKVRAKHTGCNVIVVTSLSDDQVPKALKDLQVEYRLKKPMEIEEFLAAAKSSLGLIDSEAAGSTEVGSGMTGQVNDLFKTLRADLNAIAICLVDVNGAITARAGELPEKNFESRWIPAIMSAAVSDAKVLHLFSTPSGDGIHAYMGPAFHMIFITVDENILVAVLKPEQGHSHLLMSIGVVIEAQRELLMILSGKKPVKQSRSADQAPASKKEAAASVSEEPSEKAAKEKDDFEEKLFQGKPSLADEDMDKFWETAEDEERPAEGKGIGYDEAKKMGLVDKAAKEKKN